MPSDKRSDEMSVRDLLGIVRTINHVSIVFGEKEFDVVWSRSEEDAMALLTAWRGDRERDILALLNASPLFVGPRYAECAVCHRNKKPFGRSAPLESANGYCDSDCDGYGKPPHANSLWPGERREDYGYPEELANFARALREALTRKDGANG